MGTPRIAWAALVALLAVALVVRLLVLDVPGHRGDVEIMARWAERMADIGPWGFYSVDRSVYPALLYLLWPLAAVFDGTDLARAIESLSIPFDLAIGLMLFFISRAPLGSAPALSVAGLYLLNPSVILAGPVWGQVDSAGTLPFLAALVAGAAHRHAWAGSLGVLGALVKPQFGLVLLPLIVVAAIHARRERRPRPLIGLAIGGAAAYIVVGLPLALHPPLYLGLLADAAGRQPMTSLHAFNPWGLLVGFDLPDDPYVGMAGLLLLGGMGLSLLRLRRGQGLFDLLATGALLALAFYFLPTRVHERYLFPALAVLAPLAMTGRSLLAVYAVLSLAYAASLVYALHRGTSFTLPAALAGSLTSPAAVWVIGVTMMAAAAFAAWRLLVTPRLRAAPHGRGASGVRAAPGRRPGSRS